MPRRPQGEGNPREERSVRCPLIVEHTYRKGSASLDELAKLTGADTAMIERDVAVLPRGGLQVHIDGGSRCRIIQGVPGLALPLGTREAAARVGRFHGSRCRWRMGHSRTDDND